MLRPTAKCVVPETDFCLRILFDNGEEKRFDVKPYIRGDWYSALADEQYFRQVRANGFSVEWPDGQDLCPDALYCDSTPAGTIEN